MFLIVQQYVVCLDRKIENWGFGCDICGKGFFMVVIFVGKVFLKKFQGSFLCVQREIQIRKKISIVHNIRQLQSLFSDQTIRALKLKVLLMQPPLHGNFFLYSFFLVSKVQYDKWVFNWWVCCAKRASDFGIEQTWSWG